MLSHRDNQITIKKDYSKIATDLIWEKMGFLIKFASSLA